MKTRQRMALFIALIMVFSVAGFGLSTDVADAAAKKPKKITLKTTSKYVDIKGKVTVSVKSVSPSKASKAVTWKTSNKKIATVSKKGVVTGKKKGKVTITATSKANKKVKKTIKITVKQMKPKVSLPTTAIMYSGVKKSLKAKVGPKGVWNKGITYTSSNKSIATVSKTGMVTPIKGGKVTITAKSKENKKYKDKCVVTVRQSIKSIKFSQTVKAMESGDTFKNRITKSPSSAYGGFKYTSSNSNVATVASDGTVTARNKGKATITAMAAYGLKTKNYYTVNVTGKPIPSTSDGHGNEIFVLNTNQYSKFELIAERDDSPVRVILSASDIANAFGNGNLGFDWRNAISVRDNFRASSFNYSSGTDYIFSKSGDKVTTKTPDTLIRTNWWYVQGKSFSSPDIAGLGSTADYSIKLFAKDDQTNSIDDNLFIELNKTKEAGKNKLITMENKGRSIEIIEDAPGKMVATMYKDGSPTSRAQIEKTLTGYKVTVALVHIQKYQFNLVAYK